MQKIHIIGIGEDGLEGLSRYATEILRSADVVFGGKRHLELVSDIITGKPTVRITKTEKALDEIESFFRLGKKIAVLNSGDPLFWGLAKHIIARFGKENCEVIPNLSSVQLAFARVGESWEDATLLSIHAGAEIEDFEHKIRESSKVAILTSGAEDPKKIADFLEKRKIRVREFWVCENLGGPRERVLRFERTEDVRKENFSPLNVVVILKDRESRSFKIGMPEDEFDFPSLTRGMITKSEVRAICIGMLGLREDSVVWDVGAGPGSVTVECALLAREGKVFAIEKDENMVNYLNRNLEKFGVRNVSVVHGVAPDVLEGLPDPDCVFVGGTGGKLEEIFRYCAQRVKSRIVSAFSSVKNFADAVSVLQNMGYKQGKDIRAVKVSVSSVGEGKFADFLMLNPKTEVFILVFSKSE